MSSEVLGELVLGASEHERLVVRIHDAHHEVGAGTYGHWLDAVVSIRAGAFTGEFACSMQAQDFARLGTDLERAREEFRVVVSFASLERQLAFRLTGDGLGHFRVDGQARDEPVDGNRVHWTFRIDQTNLPAVIASAKAISCL